MANKKISELPSAGALTGAELVEVVDGGINSQTTTQDIADLAAGDVVSVNGQTGVVVLDAGDIGNTPGGGIVATDVQAAINELDTEKAPLDSPTFTGTVTTPLIKITSGVPGVGKVLTSDADGDATWETPTGGGTISDAAFSSSWNGNTTDGASKNALYDKIINNGGRIFNVEFYGALHDMRTVSDANVTSGTATLTSATAAFTSGPSTGSIRVSGAGAAGVDLVTTFTVVNATTITLGTNASTTITTKRIEWGTDDTAAIQAAINAAFTNGGGIVYFPNGIYLIAGALVTSVDTINPNCQIYFPLSGGATIIPLIKLMGESTPLLPRGPFAAADEPATGVILKSVIVGTGTLPSVFGSSFANDGFVDSNRTVPYFENITVRTTSIVGVNHAAGTMTAFKLLYNASKIVKNCQAYIESTPSLSVSQSNETYGFYLDGHSRSDHGSYYENLTAVGFQSGFRVEEHSVSPRLTAVGCVYGVTVGGSGGAVHPIILGPFSAFWCNYVIRVVSNITADIVFYAENWPGSFTTYWYDRVAEVYIPSTVEINGKWRGSAYNAGTGVNVDPTVSGAFTGNFTLEKRENMPRKSYSITFETANIISASNGGYNATNATAGGEVGYYVENNRGGGASYGYMLYGGSTNAIGTIFGVSRADKMFVVADGASNLGMGVGTYLNQPLYIGTNNVARLTFSGSAATGRATFNNAAEYTEFQTTGVEGIRLIGSNATRSTIYSQATNTASQATIYLENNRGSFASYGGFLYGGATNATGNIFGVSRADKLFIFADGASNLGMGIGTLASQPLIFGTNNTERARFLGTGYFGVGVTVPTALIHVGAVTTARASFCVDPGSTTTAPSSPVSGDVWHQGTNNRLMFRKGSTSCEIAAIVQVNSVSPTAPNRTIQLTIDGTTYYIHAKTTND